MSRQSSASETPSAAAVRTADPAAPPKAEARPWPGWVRALIVLLLLTVTWLAVAEALRGAKHRLHAEKQAHLHAAPPAQRPRLMALLDGRATPAPSPARAPARPPSSPPPSSPR